MPINTSGDISLITLPSGNTYAIKDTVARATAGGGLQFRGVTTTEITDGASTSSYVVGGQTLTAQNADMVVYGTKEFIYTTSDNKWHELGDNTSLGALAYKDNASGQYIAVKTISVQTASTSSETPTLTVRALQEGESATYTPDGEISTPTISLKTAGTTDTIKNPTSQTVTKTVVASAPGTTTPSNNITYYSYDGNTETLSLYQLGYTTGDSIQTTNVTVKTGDAAYQSSEPVFTGTGTKITLGSISVPNTYNATFTTENKNVTVS